MRKWMIHQAIDLARSGSGPQVWPDALMVTGDKLAHTWELTISDRGQPTDLGGASVTAYFNRSDGATVPVRGSASGSTATVTLAQECYAIEGPLVGIFRITMGNATMTVSVLRFTVGKGPGDTIINAGDIVPGLDDLLAQIERMEAATSAANEAADNADDRAAAANTAASNATAAAMKLSSVSMAVEMLPPSSAPTATVTQTATKTTFALGIPTSNLAYATFEVEPENMELLMHSPEGFDDITFQLNEGNLEVIV